jgi:hypothetical protein
VLERISVVFHETVNREKFAFFMTSTRYFTGLFPTTLPPEEYSLRTESTRGVNFLEIMREDGRINLSAPAASAPAAVTSTPTAPAAAEATPTVTAAATPTTAAAGVGFVEVITLGGSTHSVLHIGVHALRVKAS